MRGRLLAPLLAGVFWLLAGPAVAAATEAPGASPMAVKVVVVTMFERGEPTGDAPGELQLWIERLPLDRRFDFPLGEQPLFASDDGVLAVCVGPTGWWPA